MDITYAPGADGAPDPEEVAGAWVTYEDGASFWERRPVLPTARDTVVTAARSYLPDPT